MTSGGFDTFIKCLQADPLLVDTLYLACNRHLVGKALYEAVPSKDRPTRDDLEGYMSYHPVDEDLAWSDLYPELCMWLTDYNRRKSRDEDREGEIRIKY